MGAHLPLSYNLGIWFSLSSRLVIFALFSRLKNATGTRVTACSIRPGSPSWIDCHAKHYHSTLLTSYEPTAADLALVDCTMGQDPPKRHSIPYPHNAISNSSPPKVILMLHCYSSRTTVSICSDAKASSVRNRAGLPPWSHRLCVQGGGGISSTHLPRPWIDIDYDGLPIDLDRSNIIRALSVEGVVLIAWLRLLKTLVMNKAQAL